MQTSTGVFSMAIIIIRTVIIYAALLAAMRLSGKRQIGEMELSEFAVAALIADLASQPLQDLGIPMINGLVPIITLFCCEVGISRLALKSARVRKLLYGKPSILIKKGQIVQEEMRKNSFTTDELMQQLRNQGCIDISRVEYAVLETDGRVNVLLYPREQAVTAALLNLAPSDAGYPVTIISDGKISEENMKLIKLDDKKLKKELDKRKIKDAKEVYLMTVNDNNEIYLAAKESAK